VSAKQKTSADIYVFDVDPNSDTAAANVLRLVGRDKDVLEIGAGPGSIAKPLIALNGCRVTALEYDANCIPILKEFCVDVVQGDLNTPGWGEVFGKRRFDAVVIADVLEHLVNPWETLREVTQYLRPGGSVVSSIPNANHAAMMAMILDDNVDYQDWGLLDRTHIRFFGAKNLQRLFRQAGLKIVDALFVVRTPEMTEFAENWKKTPEQVRAALELGAYSQIYQTVVKAELANSPKNEFVLLDRAPPKIGKPVSNLPFVAPPHYSPQQRPTFRMMVGRMLGPTGRRVVKSILGMR
jgi:2-polyprenyl-3-methyl-5-hydroxy-6-metoxy-1,4-benzoquinol methylase